MKFKFFILLCSALFLSCKSAKIENTEQKMQQNKENFSSGFATIIYKTTKDYSDYVPVIMNTEKPKLYHTLILQIFYTVEAFPNLRN